jgi:hypothetical protein
VPFLFLVLGGQGLDVVEESRGATERQIGPDRGGAEQRQHDEDARNRMRRHDDS